MMRSTVSSDSYNVENSIVDEDLLDRRLGLKSKEELQSEVVYLDYGGAALAPKSVMKECLNNLLSHPLCNPHTRGGKLGDYTHDLVEGMREKVLDFVGSEAKENYFVVFTAGCTASLKMVGEMFPWTSSRDNSDGNHAEYVYSTNSHNSLMSIRQYCSSWSVVNAADLFGEQSRDSDNFKQSISHTLSNKVIADRHLHRSHSSYVHSNQNDIKTRGYNLLALPGECNFTGSKLNFDNLYTYLDMLRSSDSNWMWLLDGAKLFAGSHINVSTIPSQYQPDFITMSFYKIFGYPTGIGALLIRKDKAHLMKKQYFGGGTLLAGAVNSSFLVPKPPTSPDHYEDGTINYQGIISLGPGFQFIENLGGMAAIEEFTFQRRSYLLQKMRSFRHASSGRSLCTFYSYAKLKSGTSLTIVPFSSLDDQTSSKHQGPTIAFNLFYADGSPVPFGLVGEMANAANIQLRTGCFCNLGGCQDLLNISAEDMEVNFYRGRQCSEDRDRAADVLHEQHTGACRVSVGYGTTLEDCDAFLQFLQHTFIDLLPAAADEDADVHELRGNYHHKMLITTEGGKSIVGKLDIADHDLFSTQKVQCYVSDFMERSLPSVSALPAAAPLPVALVAIYVYPVKSCAGVRVDNWPLLPPDGKGLLYDRIFAVTDENGRVLSQKMYPMLALIRPYFYFRTENNHDVVSLRLTSPFNDSDLDLPLDNPLDAAQHTGIANNDSKEVLRVCGRKVTGRRISSDADAWITTFFRYSNRQVTSNSISAADQKGNKWEEKSFRIVRSVDCENDKSPQNKNSTSLSSMSFANTAQFLLLSLESVRSLIQLIASEDQEVANDSEDGEIASPSVQASREHHKVKVENFRPNLVVSSTVPHQEDTWQQLTFPVYQLSSNSHNPENSVDKSCAIAEEKTQNLTMQVTGPCARCTMVDVNSVNGNNECRVFEALDAYRKQRGHGVCFGQFLAVTTDTEAHSSVEENSSEQQSSFTSLYVLKIGSLLQPQCK